VVNVFGASGAGSSKSVPVKYQAIVHFDYEAFVRGFAKPGERCEITGIGPVPVSMVQRMLSTSFLRVLVKKDGKQTLFDIGRYIPVNVLLQVMARSDTCEVPGCEVTHGLEFDHRRPDREGGPPTASNIIRLCWKHHQMKTHHGWCLEGDRWLKVYEKGDGGRGYPLDDDDEELRKDIMLKRAQAAEARAKSGHGPSRPGSSQPKAKGSVNSKSKVSTNQLFATG